MTKTRIGVLLFALLLLPLLLEGVGAAPARAGTVAVDSATTVIDLSGSLEVLRDPSGALSIEDMVRPDIAERFRPLPRDLAAGYDLSAFWLRFTIDVGAVQRQSPLIEVNMPYLDHVGLYFPNALGGFSAVKTGDRTPFSTRPIAHRSFVFQPDLPGAAPQTVFLRVQTTSTVSVNVKVWNPTAFAAAAARESLWLGMANGGLICIILFSAFQYRLRRDGIYLYFMGYVTATELAYAATSGYVSQFLFPEWPFLADATVGFSVSIMVGGGLLFTERTLNIGARYPRIGRIYTWVGWCSLLASLSVAFDLYHALAPIIFTCVFLSLFSSTALAMMLMRRGDVIARFFVFAYVVYIVVIAMVLVRLLGLYETPALTVLLLQAVAVPHMLLLSLGLLHRTSGLDAERLEVSRRAEREWEERVAQRTVELAETNTALASEITVRRMTEDRLSENERQVRAILDAAPFPMVVASYPDGGFLFVNQPAEELLNVDHDIALTMRTEDFYADPAERQFFISKLEEAGGILGAELHIRRMPDEQRWVLLSVVRFSYRDQDAILICLNDISTRKQLEETLRQANRRSEAALEAGHQSMREQRNFLSMVSHEFRIPLAIIQASSQLLGLYGRDDDEAQDEASKIGRAVRRLSDLIDVCLADDRIESSSWSLDIAQVDLGRLVSDLCEDKRPFIGDRTLSVLLERPMVVAADATLLRIGVSNLIDNALKFSPPASPVEIRIGGDGEGAMLCVTDYGPGIALDEQPHIFEKFYRSTKSDRVKGAGLGLYIVRRIVDLHGGCIAVNSYPGEGATFVVWLSVAAET
jgi:signal transduction histidine kinase